MHALATASDFAKRLSVPLLIIHVVETLGPENVTFGEAEAALQPQGYRQRLQTDLQEIRPTDTDVPVERLIVEGDPARKIVAIAEERGCGLIVMGTYGHTGLMRLLMMGSTTGYVVRHATCPVLTVKLPTTR
jgi:nucleotide-binding universal stress UspA family protein